MKSYYDIAMQLEVFHDYFPLEDDHVCTSLRFEPSEDCRKKLKNNRLIFKPTRNGFVLVGEKKNIGTDAAPNLIPLIDLTAGTSFYFFITEEDNDFINITDTDPRLFSDGKKYVFRNTSLQPAVVSGNIATVTIHNNTPLNETVTLAPAFFIAPVVIAENPAKIVLRGAQGQYIIEKNVPRDGFGNISAERLPLSDSPFDEGIYTVQQVNATNVVTSEKSYFLVSSMPGTTVNGIVLIEYNNVLLAQASKEIHLVIRLSPRKIHWVYNVEIERYEDPVDFVNTSIKPANLQLDASSSTPGVATIFNKTVISSSPNPADWYINDKVRFRSANLIPLQKRAYRQILLKNTAAPIPVIIGNMPNPSPLQIRETLPNTYEAEINLKVR